MKLLVTGVNGFIGTHLLDAVLKETDWTVQGFDLSSSNLSEWLSHSRFAMREGDLFKDDEWLDKAVADCDVLVPLAGIAKPAMYLKRPVWTFELDFEQNLKLVRSCARHGKRVVFPSTSEVYGASGDDELKEDESPLITGPIVKTRWIYSCSKQMMDRMIFAYGQEQGLRFTLFRPFNWIGPRLDTFADAGARTARSITQMTWDVLHRGQITLVNGGAQRRSFTWVGDGVAGVMAILRNEGNRADSQIFNLGNPGQNWSLRDLAEIIIDEMKLIPAFATAAEKARLVAVSGAEYYGKTYDDMKNRVPSVFKAKELLGWEPRTTLRQAVALTLADTAAHLK